MPKRRPNHEGSLYRRKSDGLWCCAVPGMRTRYARSEAEARKKWAEMKMQALSGVRDAAIDTTQTVSVLVNRLLTPGMAPGTLAQYRAALTRIEPAFGSRPIQQLQPIHVRTWLDRLTRDGSGDRSRQVAFDLLKRACRQAVIDCLIIRSPCDGQQRPRCTRKPPRPFEPEEARQIMTLTSSHRLQSIFKLLFLSGLRISEALGLRWDRIHWKRRSLTIDQGAVESGGRVFIREPKTESGRREIPILPELLDALKLRREQAAAEGLAECVLVHPTRTGNPVCRTSFASQIWKPHLLKLALDPRGLHQTRHTCATLLIREGVSAPIVARILGHRNGTVATDTYAHVLKADLPQALQTLGTIYYTTTTPADPEEPESEEKPSRAGGI